MLTNYLKIAARQLIKNGHYTVINIVGLAVVLACCIVAYLNYDFSYGFDAFQEKADQIYRVNSVKVVNDQEQRWGVTPMPLGPSLEKDFAFVEQAVRLSQTDAIMQVGDNVLNEAIHFADQGFFEMFTFPLKHGSAEALGDPNKIILSEELALKYFGDANPMNQAVTLRFGEAMRSFTVGGVAEKIPLNSSIQFGVLTTYDNLRILNEDMDSWGRWGLVTFIQVSDPSSLTSLTESFQPYLELQNAARPDWLIERFYFEPLPTMFMTAQATRAYILEGGIEPVSVVAPAILAVLLLLMACFNFMNTTMAFADQRLKEIGIRKVIGGVRRQLIAQFMGESLLLCLIAFGLALLLAEIFTPAYSSLWPYLDLQLDYVENAPLLLFLGGLLLVTGLIAGAYPAFYISSFSPTRIFRGSQHLRGTTVFTRSLLTFQMTISVMVIIASIAFSQNAAYQETFDLGYDKDMMLVVPLGEEERFTPYRDALLQNASILSVAGSRNHVGFSAFGRVIETEPTDQREALKSEIDLYLVGEDYATTTGLSLVEGRDFDPGMETDFTQAILVNETLVREFGWSEPVGQRVTMDSVRYEVVGVLEDFYDAGVWNPIDPAAFRLTQPEQYQYLIARVPGEKLAEANAFLESTWYQVAPDAPYEGMYQDEVMAEAMLINNSIKTVFFYIAFLTILISAAGLFALVSMNIAKRTKEIGIRKVLGASAFSISNLVNKEFAVLLLLASVLASATGYFAIDALMGVIWTYHVDMGVLPFLLGTVMIFGIAFLTVGGRVYKIATANPIKALRYE